MYFNSQILNLKSPAGGDSFIDKRAHTHDQIVEAARSGKQNIADGCMASGLGAEIC
jgi:hypothetical protein